MVASWTNILPGERAALYHASFTSEDVLANSETILGAKLSSTLMTRIGTPSRQWKMLSFFFALPQDLRILTSQPWFCDLTFGIPLPPSLWNMLSQQGRMIGKELIFIKKLTRICCSVVVCQNTSSLLPVEVVISCDYGLGIQSAQDYSSTWLPWPVVFRSFLQICFCTLRRLFKRLSTNLRTKAPAYIMTGCVGKFQMRRFPDSLKWDCKKCLRGLDGGWYIPKEQKEQQKAYRMPGAHFWQHTNLGSSKGFMYSDPKRDMGTRDIWPWNARQSSRKKKLQPKNQRGESSQDEEINEYFNYQREGHKNLKPHALLPGSLHSSQLAVFWCNWEQKVSAWEKEVTLKSSSLENWASFAPEPHQRAEAS